jgi:mRNA interferase RelE/StbE
MEVKIDSSFQRDTRGIKDNTVLKKVAETIISVSKAESISQIKHLKKLKGSAEGYRIKIGNYRIGIIISGSTIKFIRCLHRRDIYKFFTG